MARIYADLIRRGVINPNTGLPYSLDDVPQRLRSAVENLL
jgi:hypothetical protein